MSLFHLLVLVCFIPTFSDTKKCNLTQEVESLLTLGCFVKLVKKNIWFMQDARFLRKV